MMDYGAPTRTSGQALFQRVRFAQPSAALHTARTAEFTDDVQLWSQRQGAVRLMTASIRLIGPSKSMRSIIDATQPEQRHGLA
jgi:hypothetical protein